MVAWARLIKGSEHKTIIEDCYVCDHRRASEYLQISYKIKTLKNTSDYCHLCYYSGG
jgi:hypothetical protein